MVSNEFTKLLVEKRGGTDHTSNNEKKKTRVTGGIITK